VPAQPQLASDRVLLARVALAAALGTAGVVAGDRGPGALRVTADPAGSLVGVSATAARDGRYAVDLRLVTAPVPLYALADEIRAAVRAAVSRTALAPLLGDVNVEVAGVLTAEEQVAVNAAAAAASTTAPTSAASTPGSLT
jgi:uncharacterized alkaline shock family protein YloU